MANDLQAERLGVSVPSLMPQVRTTPPGASMLPTGPRASTNRQPGAGTLLAAPQPSSPQTQQSPQKLSWADQEKAYRRAMREQFPDMDEKDFEMHVQYGIQKQRGRMAAQRAKELAKPLSRYMTMLQKKEAAELAYQQVGERLKHKVAEFTLPDGRVDPGFAPYKDQLDAARVRVQKMRDNLKQHRELLYKFGVTDNDLQSPVTLHEMMRGLASADPRTADEFGDDTDLLNDEE